MTSKSGRSLVNIGAAASMTDCTIKSCASTGAYFGGNGKSFFGSCEVLRNGQGGEATLAAGGAQQHIVAPGHSGLYCQEGEIWVSDCYVAKNTFIGISGTGGWAAGGAVPTMISMRIMDSNFMGNFCMGIELPQINHPIYVNCVVVKTE